MLKWHIRPPNFTATKYIQAKDWGMVLASHSAALHVVYIMLTLVWVFTQRWKGVGYIFTTAPTHANLKQSEISICQENTQRAGQSRLISV